MADSHYPTIDISFLLELARKSDRIIDEFQVGDTYVFVKQGTRAANKRTIYIRNSRSGVVDYNFATAVALKIDKMGELLKWLEKNRKWKDGAYFK